MTLPLFKLLPFSNPSFWLSSPSISTQLPFIGLQLRPCEDPPLTNQPLLPPWLTQTPLPLWKFPSPSPQKICVQAHLLPLPCMLPIPSCSYIHPPTCRCLNLPISTWFLFFPYKRWQEWKGHDIFSVIDIYQIEQWLGSFPDNPMTYSKEFLHLTQAYFLTWGDIYNI
jgi:hypothetical protein